MKSILLFVFVLFQMNLSALSEEGRKIELPGQPDSLSSCDISFRYIDSRVVMIREFYNGIHFTVLSDSLTIIDTLTYFYEEVPGIFEVPNSFKEEMVINGMYCRVEGIYGKSGIVLHTFNPESMKMKKKEIYLTPLRSVEFSFPWLSDFWIFCLKTGKGKFIFLVLDVSKGKTFFSEIPYNEKGLLLYNFHVRNYTLHTNMFNPRKESYKTRYSNFYWKTQQDMIVGWDAVTIGEPGYYCYRDAYSIDDGSIFVGKYAKNSGKPNEFSGFYVFGKNQYKYYNLSDLAGFFDFLPLQEKELLKEKYKMNGTAKDFVMLDAECKWVESYNLNEYYVIVCEIYHNASGRKQLCFFSVSYPGGLKVLGYVPLESTEKENNKYYYVLNRRTSLLLTVFYNDSFSCYEMDSAAFKKVKTTNLDSHVDIVDETILSGKKDQFFLTTEYKVNEKKRGTRVIVRKMSH
ncbi:MAG: hypothetical protein ACOZCO_06630 [Bacteroidota bacterium]